MIHDGVELPSLLSLDRAARVLGVPVESVRARIENGTLSSVRVNGSLRVCTESIDDRKGVRTLSRTNAEAEQT